MAFYPHFSGFYAYPMPIPSQDFYAMYPSNVMDPNATMFYDNHNMGHQHFSKYNKPGFNNRKISQDSGISDFSSKSSRKTSNTSTISSSSIVEESTLDKVQDEPEAPIEIPSDEVCQEIVEQVEFYFSNANITKDKFLLKHVKRNKEGFVSLKLISSFKRVKHLSKDWRQVAYAVEKKSKQLEVNDLKTKVRRLEALPEYDETTPSRTVVVMNLPIERPTIESVAEMFSVCGEIVLVRILRPGNPIPVDVRPFVNKHPEMASKVCALVEFEKTEFSRKAIGQLNNDEDEKMKVLELTAPPPVKTGKKSEDKKKVLMAKASQPMRRYSQGMMPAQMMMMNDANENAPRRKHSLLNNMKFNARSDEQEKGASLNPEAPVFTMKSRQPQRRLSRPSQPHFMMDPGFGMIHPMQPFPGWMSRRVSGQMDFGSVGMVMPQHVMRQPKGPAFEKGKGFQKWCRNRMEPAPKPGSRAVPIIAPTQSKNDDETKSMAMMMPEIAKVVVPIAEESSTSDDDDANYSDRESKAEKAR